MTVPSFGKPPPIGVTVAVNATGCAATDGFGDADTTVVVAPITVTAAVAWLVAPDGLLTVNTTIVRPIGYGPGGDCVMVSGSPSASDDPLSIDTAAVPDTPAVTVTSLATATGTWFSLHVPPQTPATFSVYWRADPQARSSSCTLTTKVCAPPARENA